MGVRENLYIRFVARVERVMERCDRAIRIWGSEQVRIVYSNER